MNREEIINEIAKIFEENDITIIKWNKISNEKPPIVFQDDEMNESLEYTYLLDSIDFEGVWGIRMNIDPGYILFEELSDEEVLYEIYETLKNYFNYIE